MHRRKVGRLAWFHAFVLGLSATVLLPGCRSLQAYDGSRPRSEIAKIIGNMRLTAGEPVSVVIRRVDDTDVGLTYNSVSVLPGPHSLLIDCTVTESKATSRHHLTVNVEAGATYRLVASTRPGNRECADVQAVSVN